MQRALSTVNSIEYMLTYTCTKSLSRITSLDFPCHVAVNDSTDIPYLLEFAQLVDIASGLG